MVPLPDCSSAPVPEIVPPRVTVPVSLIASVALSVTLPLRLPVLPPLPSCSTPALIVVRPVAPSAPVRDSVPVPCFSRPPVPLIAPENSVLLAVPAVRVPAPRVMLPAPDRSPVVCANPARSKVAPLATASGPLPAALVAPSRKMPDVTVSPPEKLFGPDSTVTPLPSCVSVPVPEIVPAIVTVPVWSISRALLSTMLPLRLPVAPPEPSCTAPALIVVAAEKLLEPVRVRVPLPCLTRPPLPLIDPAKLVEVAPVSVITALPRLTDPEPDSALMVWLKVPRLRDPPASTVMAPLPMAPVAPATRLPAAISKPPPVAALPPLKFTDDPLPRLMVWVAAMAKLLVKSKL